MDDDTLVRMNDAQGRDRVLGEFNASTLGSVGPLGGDQGMKVLQEMNELGEAQEQIIREGVPKIGIRFVIPCPARSPAEIIEQRQISGDRPGGFQ